MSTRTAPSSPPPAAPVPLDASCHDAGCAGFSASRRSVLRGLAVGGVTTVTGSAVTTMAGGSAFAGDAAPGDDSILVVVSLRGAADGLSMVVPHGDPVYYQARPRIAVPADQLLGRDAFFGLHPAMQPLLPMWTAGELGAIHATGLPVANRSHFAAMEELEDADPGSTQRTGWLNRLLGESASNNPVEGLCIGSGTSPTSMYGDNPAISFGSLDTATLAGDNPNDLRHSRRVSLEQMWASDDSRMGRALRGALTAIDDLAPAARAADNAARYPSSDLGRALADLAQTLRGGSRHPARHDRLRLLGPPQQRRHACRRSVPGVHRRPGEVAGGLLRRPRRRALPGHAGDHQRVRPPRGGELLVGLDHGWGNAMLVAGAGVSGGRYYGRWPGLENALDADLRVTTDYRSVLAEIVAARFPGASTSTVFPQFTRERVGFMRGQ